MSESLSIPSTPDRCCGNAGQATSSAAPRQAARTTQKDIHPRQILWQNSETTGLNPQAGASVTVKDKANRTLSP